MPSTLNQIFNLITQPQALIAWAGIIGVLAVIFAESGLFFGFFLPGDSLLFTAGLLASQGHLSIAVLILGGIGAAILGDAVGYTFGRRVGPALFERPNSRFFKAHHVARARIFYENHGRKTIIIARFMPIVRTFAPIIAGVAAMPYRTFATYNIIGACLWVCSLSILGYVLGSVVPNIDHYILPIILAIILISFLPGLVSLRSKKSTVQTRVDKVLIEK